MRPMLARSVLIAVGALFGILALQQPVSARESLQKAETMRFAEWADRPEVIEAGARIDIAGRAQRKASRKTAISRERRTVSPAVNDPTLNRLLDNKRPIEVVPR